MFESPQSKLIRQIQRRAFLSQIGVGLGSIAASTLLNGELAKGATAAPVGYHGLVGLPRIAARAKRVIFLCMAGGPSHLETFDYKPKLEELHGQPMPESYTAGQPVAQLQGQQLVAHRPMFKFARRGQSGQWMSDLLPWHHKLADDICVVRSMVTEQINHDPAHTFLNCGTAISGRPSMGSWVNYGLGSENEDLPGFVVLTSIGGREPDQPIASRQWSSGFLPSRFQGVEFNSSGDPVHYVRNPPGVPPHLQRASVDAIHQLDRHRNALLADPETETRIAAYETAYRMQTSVPDLMDVSAEPAHVLKLYGATPGDGSFASNCLLARRLAERGVRFIHLYHRGWDHHGELERDIQRCAQHTDQASYALITDLKQRGMLDDTLVIWGGEFGRTPMVQHGGGGPGRDHHIKGFSLWMAGGGVKSGFGYGATDELGYHAAENIVHVRDLHATMLHLLGIDHHSLTFRYQGLHVKLTGVEEARVVDEIMS
ncbi:DUF1501 domain-containing protein [Lacipirellula sp.]|uniref:DUF1501 domain-containing protein n=1 Tax=Lacipirellula sp. TaxID=2691419 RepID=UPI003D0B60B5